MEDLKLIKNLLFVICGLVAIVLVLGYFALKKDNSAEFKALVQQNKELTEQIAGISKTIQSKIDSVSKIQAKIKETKTYYERDIYHIYTVTDKDTLVNIIRGQMKKLDSPRID